MSKAAANKRATRSAPTIGRSIACLTPPPSLMATTSGARMSSKLSRSPVDRPLEGLEYRSGLGRRNDPARSARGDVRPRSVSDLADR